jgi:hypothetical protein
LIRFDERVSKRLLRIFDWFLVGFVGVLLLAVMYLVVHRDAYLHRTLDVAALVASVALAAALLATFRLPSLIRAKIVLMIAFSMATLYAMELILFWDPLKLRGTYPRDGFDQRGYLEVVRDLRAGGTRAYPVLAAVTWLESPPSVMGMPVVPLSGVPHATTVMCNESGSYVTYESDRFGFNGPDEIWDLSAEIALVGDSFVEGWCVPREDSLAAVVRNAHPATLSVGYTGHGPLAELGTIREYVAPLRPAHVFWIFYEGNDLIKDLPAEMASAVLRRYLEPDFNQQLRLHSVVIGNEMRRRFDERLAASPEAPPPVVVSVAKLRTLRAMTGIAVGPARPVVRSVPTSLADFGKILTEAKRTVEEWGGSLHFVYLPDLQSVIGDVASADHDRVLALAADLGLPTIDMLPVFRTHPNPLSLFPYEEGRHLVKTQGLHYNAQGHRLVGIRIVDAIESLGGNGEGRH